MAMQTLTTRPWVIAFPLVLLAACARLSAPPIAPSGSAEAYPATDMVRIPAGRFIMGSTERDRQYGYRLDEERGSTAARKYQWFANETRRQITLPAYDIDRNLVTNADYQRFVLATGHRPPYVSETTWADYGLVHPYRTAQRFNWTGTRYPPGRGKHPVVLVSAADAADYCRWRGQREHRPLRLPSEAEWEKAARGTTGQRFPWGNDFDPEKLNSADAGPFDTTAVDRYPDGASPYGVLNMAGMVFEWTATACPDKADQFIVKGGSWDDFPGVTRSAARHCRPRQLKHVLIGFRCAADAH